MSELGGIDPREPGGIGTCEHGGIGARALRAIGARGGVANAPGARDVEQSP